MKTPSHCWAIGVQQTLPLEIRGRFYNSGSQPISVRLGVRIVRPKGEEEYISPYGFTQLEPTYVFSSLKFTIPAIIKKGTYKMLPVFQSNQNEKWNKIPVEGDKEKNYRIEVDQSGVSFIQVE